MRERDYMERERREKVRVCRGTSSNAEKEDRDEEVRGVCRRKEC